MPLHHFGFVDLAKRLRNSVLLMWVGVLLGFAACATNSKELWNSRIGHYSYDQAVLELGPPDKMAQLTDGTKVGEWMTHRGGTRGTFFGGPGPYISYNEFQTPDYFLRLSFDAAGNLKEWRKLVR
jgi:hypothetical protein